MTSLSWVDSAAAKLVLVAWIGFAAVFFLRKHPPRGAERRRAPRSRVGVGLQGIALALVWSARRPVGAPFLPLGPATDLALSIVAVLTAFGAVLLVLWGVQVLGRQWSVSARLIDGHELVRSGPYAWVRHPIHAGLTGMFLATSLVFSRSDVFLLAALLYGIGTRIRTRVEDRLLRESFGAEYEAYAARVRALFPWPRGAGASVRERG